MGEALITCRGRSVKRGTVSYAGDTVMTGYLSIHDPALVNVKNAIIYLNGNGTSGTNTGRNPISNIVIEDGEVVLAVRVDDTKTYILTGVAYYPADGKIITPNGNNAGFAVTNTGDATPVYDYIIFD